MMLRGRHWLVLWLMLFLGVAAAATGCGLAGLGAAGAAGVILLIGYVVRRRVGYDPHREKPGDGDEECSRDHLAGVVSHRGDLNSRLVSRRGAGGDPGCTQQFAQANHVAAV